MPSKPSGFLLSDRMRAFLAVAEAGSFRLAGQALKVGQSTVSRHISELEESISARLFQRTTRSVVLTEAGRHFLEHCQAALRNIGDAEKALRMLSDKPAGHLVAHVPVSFGRLHLAPIIHEFTAAHPYLTVEIVLSDDYADFSDSLIDVAIRIGRLSQGSLIARKLCDNVRQLCAAPSYVETFGAPEHPRDLADHACLEFTPLRTAGTWQFVSGDEEQTVVKPRSVLKSNNAELLLAAALNGVGIGIPAHFLAAAHLRSGALVPLLPDWKIVSSAIYVVYPDRSQLPPKTRSFVDFVVDRFSGTLPWDRD